MRPAMKQRSAAAMVVVLAAWVGGVSACRRSAVETPPPDASTPAVVVTKSAGADVLAMLGELKRGDVVEGFTVEDVGAVREDGAVPIRLRRGEVSMQLAVTLAPDNDEPRPPARTQKYAVYYETGTRGRAAGDEECQRAAKAMAERIKSVEETVPTPAGMREPHKAGQPA